jgi:hypothetical protein
MFQNLFVYFNYVCPSFHCIHYFLQLFVVHLFLPLTTKISLTLGILFIYP